MTSFRCRVVGEDGAVALRVVDAPSRDEAILLLIAEGFTPIEIRSGEPSLIDRALGWQWTGANRWTIDCLFDLGRLLGQGTSPPAALAILAETARPKAARDALGRMAIRARDAGLAAALSDERAFPPSAAAVAKLAGGSPRNALSILAEALQRMALLRDAAHGIFTIPLALVAAALLLIDGLDARGGRLAVPILSLIGATILILRLPAVTARLDRIRTPWRNLRDRYLAALATRLAAALLAIGVPVDQATEIVAGEAGAGDWRTRTDAEPTAANCLAAADWLERSLLIDLSQTARRTLAATILIMAVAIGLSVR